MTASPPTTKKSFARYLPELATLAAGLLVTAFTLAYTARAQDEIALDTFQRDVDKVTDAVGTRLKSHFDMLLALRGFYRASDEVDRREFTTFIREMDLQNRYPGFQAVQLVKVVPHAQLPQFTEAVRHDRLLSATGYPQFEVKPPSAQDPHYVITFTEPMAGNEAAFGFDLATVPAHREAIMLARDTGNIIATPPVRLRQEIGEQAGFVARVPLYRNNGPLETITDRRAAFHGLGAIVFRVNNLLQEVVDHDLLRELTLNIDDVGLVDDEEASVARDAKFLYDSRKAAPEAEPSGAPLLRVSTTRALDVGHRRWELHFVANDGPRYGRRLGMLASIAIGGALISLLSALLVADFRRRRLLSGQLSVALAEQRAFLDNAVVGIALWAGGGIQRQNRGVEEMLGYGPHEMLGTTGEQIFLDHGQYEAALAQVTAAITAGRRYQAEWQLRRKDGSLMWCAMHAQAVDRQDLARGAVWVLHDITDRKRAEAALVQANEELEQSLTEVEQQKTAVQQAHDDLSVALEQLQKAQENLIFSEKMASLGSMVAGIAHELNTPIGNSLLAATALSDRVAEFEEIAQGGALKRSALLEHLHDTRTACTLLAGSLNKAAHLIASFKQVAVDQTIDERRHFDLDKVLADTLATYAVQMRRRNCEAVLQVAPGLQFESYPGSLGQVISNLIVNAMLHAFQEREQGRITVRAQEMDSSWVELVFEDDGEGMSADVLHRIFDPFFTTKMGQGGSGLGMNIVYNIVTRVLGGRITVESAVGHGTRIRIVLPKVAPQRGATEEEQAIF